MEKAVYQSFQTGELKEKNNTNTKSLILLINYKENYMNSINNERAGIDIFNYLSIDALEKIGIMEPTEKQILLMEKLLRDSVAKEFKFNKYKGFQVIA